MFLHPSSEDKTVQLSDPVAINHFRRTDSKVLNVSGKKIIGNKTHKKIQTQQQPWSLASLFYIS